MSCSGLHSSPRGYDTGYVARVIRGDNTTDSPSSTEHEILATTPVAVRRLSIQLLSSVPDATYCPISDNRCCGYDHPCVHFQLLGLLKQSVLWRHQHTDATSPAARIIQDMTRLHQPSSASSALAAIPALTWYKLDLLMHWAATTVHQQRLQTHHNIRRPLSPLGDCTAVCNSSHQNNFWRCCHVV